VSMAYVMGGLHQKRVIAVESRGSIRQKRAHSVFSFVLCRAIGVIAVRALGDSYYAKTNPELGLRSRPAETPPTLPQWRFPRDGTSGINRRARRTDG
jgi:hypothetical protein